MSNDFSRRVVGAFRPSSAPISIPALCVDSSEVVAIQNHAARRRIRVAEETHVIEQGESSLGRTACPVRAVVDLGLLPPSRLLSAVGLNPGRTDY